eukprot:CAMPEP_0181511500 /NCGR_PEP_ID=MMETSP1110-20121109/61464_1 /TAXON_ID=174948 /ORGANISM="Symbiodinium sp., Strain CCMP421" /LENGTH=31 /DNA_ID= /DNA_START= /DNA_END= /DNA_ORIENTATION=
MTPLGKRAPRCSSSDDLIRQCFLLQLACLLQ